MKIRMVIKIEIEIKNVHEDEEINVNGDACRDYRQCDAITVQVREMYIREFDS